jgi:hypothetical protein
VEFVRPRVCCPYQSTTVEGVIGEDADVPVLIPELLTKLRALEVENDAVGDVLHNQLKFLYYQMKL